VTFLWRDAAARGVLLMLNKVTHPTVPAESALERVPGTDVWHRSFRLRDDWRGSYQIAPDTLGHGRGRTASRAGTGCSRPVRQRRPRRAVLARRARRGAGRARRWVELPVATRGRRAGSVVGMSQALSRPRSGKVIAGVCAAIANRLGVSPWLVRACFIISCALPGPQFIVYLLGWVLIPKQG